MLYSVIYYSKFKFSLYFIAVELKKFILTMAVSGLFQFDPQFSKREILILLENFELNNKIV